MINKLMTVLTSTLFFAPGLSAHAATIASQIYHCEYRVVRDGNVFTMNGNIVPVDATTLPSGETYLTLEPPEVSGIDVTARILITYWTDNGNYYYNPMTLHPRGDTANALASTVLSGKEQQLTYEDEGSKTSYTLSCKMK